MSLQFEILGGNFAFMDEAHPESLGCVVLSWHAADSSEYTQQSAEALTLEHGGQLVSKFIQFARADHLVPQVEVLGENLVEERFLAWASSVNELSAEPSVTSLEGLIETVDTALVDRLVAARIAEVLVLVEGLEQRHDALHGQGAFERSLEACRLFIASGLRSGCVMRLQPENGEDLLPLVDLLANSGILRCGVRVSCIMEDTATWTPTHLVLRFLERLRYWRDRGVLMSWCGRGHCFDHMFRQLGLRDTDQMSVMYGQWVLLSDGTLIAPDGTRLGDAKTEIMRAALCGARSFLKAT